MSKLMRQLAAEGRAAREAAERAKAEAKHPLYEVKVDPAAPLQGQEWTSIWVDEFSPSVDPLKPCEHGKYYYCTKCGGYRGPKP